MTHARRSEEWSLVLIGVGTLACLIDAFTTWVALHDSTGRFHEYTPATATLIASVGLTAGLAISILARIAAFAAVAVAAERLPRLSKPILAIGLLAVGLTWLIVLGNITALAAN
jgi:hypothetical protein